MRIKSISHMGITVKDFDRAVRWYWEVFRMPLVSVSEMSKEDVGSMRDLYQLDDCSLKLGFLLGPKGGVIEIFEFSRTEEMNHAWNRPGVTHFTLDVKNIKAWHNKLSGRKDVTMLTTPQNTGGNEWFFFRDPDGNLIELIDLKLNYFALRYLGRIVGFFLRKGPMKPYYSTRL